MNAIAQINLFAHSYYTFLANICIFVITMKELSEIQITSFDNMKSSKSTTIPLFQEFGNIKRGKYKDLIIKCREAVLNGNKDLYSSLKSKLPVVTFCGVFKFGRKANDITEYNNLMIIDIDNLDANMLKIATASLHKDKFIMALWLSPSGQGLKGIIKIDSEVDKHKYVFNALRIYFLENHKIDLDRSGSDISRLCFSSWDENLFFNKDSIVFNDFLEIDEDNSTIIKREKKFQKTDVINKNAFATEGFNKLGDTKTVKHIINFLIKNDVSITETYDSWVKVALGISYTFSYDVGEKYFLQICALDKEKHSEDKSISLLKYCYNKRQYNISKPILLSTIIYFAKQKGFSVKRV